MCLGHVTYTFQISSSPLQLLYKRIEYALNMFGARLRHASVCCMRIPILGDVASLACPKGVKHALKIRWVHIARA